jgi:xanthine dehydrogenase accessory factor
VGGGHCGRALAKVASLLHFDIVVVDDRPDYARPEDFPYPNVSQTLCAAPDFSDIPLPDENTYVALISKGYLSDEAALRRILDTSAAYIGLIGSKRKRDTVYENLRKDGISQERLERIFAPIGIEIGAETPEEIAISILAEIVRVRAKNRTAPPPHEAP